MSQTEKMSTIDFFKMGLKNLKTVGTVTRSSRFLCKKMVEQVDWKNGRHMVELGAGDGVITKHIVKAMHPNANLLTFEILPKLADRIREINDPRVHVIEDSAEYLRKYLDQHQMPQADAIISAIPFVAFPDELAYKIIRTCYDHLRPGGRFVQVHYSLLAKKKYEEVFGNVDIEFVPLNVPPAFVLICDKPK